MLDGSWLMAQGSWLMAKGGQGMLMAHGPGPEEARGAGPGPEARLWVPRAGAASGHEPWASPGLPWPWAMSLGP